MTYEYLHFRVADGVAEMTLARVAAANAMNIDLTREMMDVSIRCDEDPSIRALLIRAEGKMFCAGGDLKSFAAFGDDIGAALKEMTIYLHGAISRFARMDAPVIVAVQGMAAGAGMSLAVCGDLVLAAESAAFTMAYTAAGLSPDGSSSYFLPRLIGLRRTQELMLTNRRLSAQEAVQWGLVNRVVPDADLDAEARSLATRLASGPTAAFGSVKRLLTSTYSCGLETQMELEAREIVDNAKGSDGQEGIAAFTSKRAASFCGVRG